MLQQSRVYAHNSRIFQDIFLLLEEEMKCGRHNDLAKQNNEMRLSSLISSFWLCFNWPDKFPRQF